MYKIPSCKLTSTLKRPIRRILKVQNIKTMNDWKLKHQSSDIIKCNARNTYIEVYALNIQSYINTIIQVALKSSQRITLNDQIETQLSCMTRKFKIHNNQRHYSAGEEKYISNIYSIDGKLSIILNVMPYTKIHYKIGMSINHQQLGIIKQIVRCNSTNSYLEVLK